MQQNNSKQSNQSDIELSFITILRILLSSIRLIVLTTIAVGAFGWIYLFFFYPTLPPNFESDAIIEIGSFPAPNDTRQNTFNGRMLIDSMNAIETRLNLMFGLHEPLRIDIFNQQDYTASEPIIQRITIEEIDSRFLKIEIVGSTMESVKNKNNEIIETLKSEHDERLNQIVSIKKREIQNFEKKLITIDKFINYISEQNDIYVSDVVDLKLKEIDYESAIVELDMELTNTKNYKHTDFLGEIQFKTNYPKTYIKERTFFIFVIGFMLSSLFVLIRHALARNYKE